MKCDNKFLNIYFFSIPETPGKDFVRIGHIFDAVGASNPNTNLEYEKIVVRPTVFGRAKPIMLANRLEKLLVGNAVAASNNDIVGETLHTFEEVRKAFGVKSVKGLLLKMRRILKKMLKQNRVFNVIPQKQNRKINAEKKGG